MFPLPPELPTPPRERTRPHAETSSNIPGLRSLPNFSTGALPKLPVLADRRHVASFIQAASPCEASIPVRLRRFDTLSTGQRLGGAEIVSLETVPYDEPFTYDILPASDTGTYFVGGAWVGSTLHDGRCDE